MTRKPVATKIAVSLSSVGPEALERYNNFECQEREDKAKYNHVKTKLDTELEGQKRIVFSNYPFWDHSKTSGQTFDEFLSQPSLSCEFAELDNMRDRERQSLGKVLFKVWRSKPLHHEIVDQGSSKAEFFVDCLYVEKHDHQRQFCMVCEW